jgi:hypothetical protein
LTYRPNAAQGSRSHRWIQIPSNLARSVPMNMKQAAAQLQKAMNNMWGAGPKHRADSAERPRKSAVKRGGRSARKSRSTRGR